MPKRTEHSERVIVDGEKLKTKRLEKGLSQKEIAYKARVSVRTISNLERGGEYLYHPTGPLKRIATALGVSEVQSLLARTSSQHAGGLKNIEVLDDVNPSPSSPPEFFIGSSYVELSKDILARDAEAEQLLNKLGEVRMVSVVAPAGFGKTALMVRAIQKVLVGDGKLTPGADLDSLVARAGLKGIAILNAAENKPLTIKQFAEALNRMLGRHGSPGATAEEQFSEQRRRHAFFELLQRAGKLWIVVENAEEAFERQIITPELRSLLVGWCAGLHVGKLILLSRFALHPAPACHGDLAGVHKSLKDGLPPDAAIALFRRNLATQFVGTPEPMLHEIAVNRLHGMPIAIEAFAGYLDYKQEDIPRLDQEFLNRNEPLHLFHEDQKQKGNRFFFKIIEEQIARMDLVSRLLLQVVAWAGVPVPEAGLLALKHIFGARDNGAIITRLVKSNLLVQVAHSPGEGTTFAMHALIRAAIRESFGKAPDHPLDFFMVSKALSRAADHCYTETTFSQVLVLVTLAERALREEPVKSIGPTDLERELVRALLSRGIARGWRGYIKEQAQDYSDAIKEYQRLVNEEGQIDLEGELANAIGHRGILHGQQRRNRDAIKDFDDAIARLRILVKSAGRLDLQNDLALAIMNRAIVYGADHRTIDYEAGCDEAIDLFVPHSDAKFLALAITNRGKARAALGRLREAETDYDEVIAICETLIANQGRSDLEIDLADVVTNRGSVLAKQGRFEEAETECNDAVRRYRRLVDDKGRADLEVNLAIAIRNRALAYKVRGRYVDAAKDYEEVFWIFHRLVIEQQRDDLEDYLARAIVDRAWVRLMQGLNHEAKTALEEAIALYERLITSRSRLDLEEEFANTVMNHGVVAGKLGQLDDEANDYDRVVRIYQGLMNRGRLGCELGLIDAVAHRGSVRGRQGKFEDAESDYAFGVESYRRLRRQGNRDVEGKMARAILDRGGARDALGRLQEAFEDYDEAIQIYLRLVKQDGHLELEADLADAISNRGCVNMMLGNVQEQAQDFENALKIYARLVNDRGRIDLEDRLAKAILNLAYVRGGENRLEEAKAGFEEARRRLLTLVTRDGRVDLEHPLAHAYYGLSLTSKEDMIVALTAAHEAHRLYCCLVNRGVVQAQEDMNKASELKNQLGRKMQEIFDAKFDPDDGDFPDAGLRRRVHTAVGSVRDRDIQKAVLNVVYDKDRFTDDEAQAVLSHFMAACSGGQGS